MSAESLRCLILGRDPSGESHFLLTYLEPSEGLMRCLLRARGSKAATMPDLFDEGEVTLERAKDGGTRFARDYRLLTRRGGLARNHRTLERASRLASMLRKNPPPPESAEVCYRIALETFDAMAARPRADCAYFKSLWLILKDGGWGVHEQWFARLGARQATAAAILGQPLDAQTTDEETVAVLTTDLERWSAGEAHFVLP
jgi:recombinational DNA repair protein (RecF pathway)